MKIVADASVFLSVILNESDREWVVEKTSDCTIVSPEILPYEIGNGLVVVKRKGRLTDRETLRAFDMSQRIAVRLMSINLHEALHIALRFNIFAYDAYYLQCCTENGFPLISLDRRMCDVARSLDIKVVE
jgi:predicted nucleic acid-binding protein